MSLCVRSVIVILILLLPLGCTARKPILHYKTAHPCKEVQISGTMQLYIGTIKIVAKNGDSYEVEETESCQYECPKPERNVPYIRLGNEQNAEAYCPISNKYIYTIKGCVDESKHTEKILHATSISYIKK